MAKEEIYGYLRRKADVDYLLEKRPEREQKMAERKNLIDTLLSYVCLYIHMSVALSYMSSTNKVLSYYSLTPKF